MKFEPGSDDNNWDGLEDEDFEERDDEEGSTY